MTSFRPPFLRVNHLLFAATLLLASSQAFSAKAQTGLSFYPITPCRIVDTRNAGGILQSGITRAFIVNQGGTSFNYTGQGGSSTGCGIPTNAQSVFFNFVIVSPTAPGFFQAWPVGTTQPTASISNFANLTGLNIANGIAVPVCSGTCSSDLNVQVNQASAELVIDVVGYFK